MRGFCADGDVPAFDGVIQAAEHWFPERAAGFRAVAAAHEKAIAPPPPPAAMPVHSVEEAARILSEPQIPDALRHDLADVVTQTVHRLRALLHQGKLKAHYFGADGRQVVFTCDFWASQAADGVLERSAYQPFGMPTFLYEPPRPSYPLFLAQSELDAVLSKWQDKPLSEKRAQQEQRPFPPSKIHELAAALKTIELPRKDQRQALQAKFPKYRITEAIFREAKQSLPPRDTRWRKPQN